MLDFIDIGQLGALFTVIMIDLVMAGDNAIIIGMVAASVPVEMRRKVIVIGILAATLLRILFACITVQLLKLIGLMLAGGLILLWVAWRMWWDIRKQHREQATAAETASTAGAAEAKEKTLTQAATQIVLADLSMSLDNVLAVAGAAGEHLWVLVIGLVLSVALMGIAANYIAGLLERHRWLAYVGLGLVAYVALSMIWSGGQEVFMLASRPS